MERWAKKILKLRGFPGEVSGYRENEKKIRAYSAAFPFCEGTILWAQFRA
jgi:hypothetical protein